VRSALDLAATLGVLGVAGVQVDAAGPLHPDQLSQTGRREFRSLLRARGLELAALGCPLRHGFDTGLHLDARVSHVKKVLGLAYELGAQVVTAFVGRLDLTEKDAAWPFLFGSLGELARHGDRIGAALACETGLEAPEAVAGLLARFETVGLGVQVDPATLLAHRHDPAAAVRAWQGRVLHVQARDVRLSRSSRERQDVPVGEGDVDWLALLGGLEEVGYRGWLTVGCPPGEQALSHLRSGLAFLKQVAG
jgi:sugar phosphate isomerase/epimerase